MKVVVAALLRNNGAVLLSQRRADQSHPLMWELPGGKIEQGESPADALEREIKEELDCTVRVGRVYDVLFHRYPDFDVLMLVYACELLDEPSAHDVAAIRWVSVADELANIDILPADAPLVSRLKEES